MEGNGQAYMVDAEDTCGSGDAPRDDDGHVLAQEGTDCVEEDVLEYEDEPVLAADTQA